MSEAKNCFYLETDSDISQINSLIEIYNKDKTRKKPVRELSKVKLPSCRGLPANIVPSQHSNCEKLKNGTCRVKPIVRQTFKSLKQAPKSKSSVKTTAKKFVKKSPNPEFVHPTRPRGPAGRKRPTRKKKVLFPGFPKKNLVYKDSYPYSGFQWRYQSCYLASIIQMITHLSPLVHMIRNPSPQGDMDRHPILVILDELMSDMTKYQVVPKKYFSSIHSDTSFRVKLDKLLVGYDIARDFQQDSTEIFSLILGGGGIDTPEYNRFRNLSLVNIQTTMTCVECETPKLSQELQSPLNIPLIKQARSRSRSRKAQCYSIEDLLTNTYGQVETLDSDNKVWCEECQKLELFNRVNLIHSHPEWKRRSAQTPLPPVLFLSFNRFRYDMRRNTRIKIDTRITFSPILDLSPYLTEDAKEIDARYRLVSVIHHMGTSANAGHYYCYNLVVGEDKEPEWIKFDDSDVSRIEQKRPDILPEELFCSDSRNKGLAYMLAYQKLDIPLQRYDPLPVDPKLLNSDSDSESNDLFEFSDNESDSDGSESVLHCNEIIIGETAYQVVISGSEKGNIYLEDSDDGPTKIGSLKCYRNDDSDSRKKYENLEQHEEWVKDKLTNDTRWKKN